VTLARFLRLFRQPLAARPQRRDPAAGGFES
jgi:hypothetical protein